ncbi:MAG TPA: carbamoyltransferase HypF, partial [Bacteroidetes bacterium]|nr:carbamoyltransferase HypF [Bacteroidota bacterium]
MTFHIHIKGIVQGVGFRPFVYKLALKHGLNGDVNNTTDGVHINVECDEEKANEFLNEIIKNAPALSVITGYTIEKIRDVHYDDFQIIHSESEKEPNLLLTPDFALCEDCRKELHDPENRRCRYPFITCTNCGPRYSIITGLPYDRPLTTMQKYKMCDTCEKEYNNPLDRRYFSQTNSCEECGVKLSIYENGSIIHPDDYIKYIVSAWKEGKIVAIKGIGGFLLTCDATDEKVIQLLRERKYRPSKPFALMYPDIEMIKEDCDISDKEETELKSVVAPIVLLKLKDEIKTGLDITGITNGLDRIGVMLPYAPLYDLLLKEFQKPVIATSGNVSNSTIIYSNEKALKELDKIADVILLNDRDIVIPQDDSVVKYSEKYHKKIIIRRSRGIAPSFIKKELELSEETVMCMGASLKSAFAILNKKNIYISQYLGDTGTYDAQLNYTNTQRHFFNLLDLKPDRIVIDKHPDYFSSVYGMELAEKYNIPVKKVQHHKAHFAAVLAENDLLDCEEKVLGVVFDGTGYGDDGNIWGGEFFIFNKGEIERYSHLDYFDFILADKMVKEPRISALAISKGILKDNKLIKAKFNKIEWGIYDKILKEGSKLKSSSMGRLVDAVSSIVLGIDKQTYEGEAAMKLEVLAADYLNNKSIELHDSYIDAEQIDNILESIIKGIINDLDSSVNKNYIAAKFHISIIRYIKNIANM